MGPLSYNLLYILYLMWLIQSSLCDVWKLTLKDVLCRGPLFGPPFKEALDRRAHVSKSSMAKWTIRVAPLCHHSLVPCFNAHKTPICYSLTWPRLPQLLLTEESASADWRDILLVCATQVVISPSQGVIHVSALRTWAMHIWHQWQAYGLTQPTCDSS